MAMKKIVLSLALLVVMVLGLIFAILNKGPSYSEDELVGEWYSPNKSVKVCIYQGPPQDAVMVDFYVVGEIQYEGKSLFNKKMIYYKYHEAFEDCYWEDNEKVVINGNVINVNDKGTWICEE